MAEVVFYAGLLCLLFTMWKVWRGSGEVKRDLPWYPMLIMAAGVMMKLVFHVG